MYTHIKINNLQQKRVHVKIFLIDDDHPVNFPACFSETTDHGFSSDHSYISLTIQGSRVDREKGYWKLNNSHLAHDILKTGYVKLYAKLSFKVMIPTPDSGMLKISVISILTRSLASTIC